MKRTGRVKFRSALLFVRALSETWYGGFCCESRGKYWKSGRNVRSLL